MPYDPKETYSERRARQRREDREDAQHVTNLAWLTGPTWALMAVALLAILIGGVFAIRTVMMPAEERLRRDTYEESKSYLDGTVRDLDNLHLQWLEASNDGQRAMLAQVALQRSVDFPDERLPARLTKWLDSIR